MVFVSTTNILLGEVHCLEFGEFGELDLLPFSGNLSLELQFLFFIDSSLPIPGFDPAHF